MTYPVLKGSGPMASATTDDFLDVTLPAHSTRDLLVLHTKGVAWFGGNAGRPLVPPGWRELDGSHDANGFEQILWRRVGAGDAVETIRLEGSQGQTGTTWYAHADSFSHADFRDPGWIEPVAGAVSHGLFTRADVTAPTTLYRISARIEVGALGVNNWVVGWNTGDMHLGINSSNRLQVRLRNTLGNAIGNAQSSVEIPGLQPGDVVWIRGDIDIATATCTYYYSFADVENWWAVFYHWTQLGTPQVGSNAGTTVRVTNSDSFFVGSRGDGAVSTDVKVYSVTEQVEADIVIDENFSDDLPAGWSLVNGATHRVPTPELGQSSPIEDWRIGGPFSFVFGFVLPARQVFGEDRLTYNVWTGASFTGQQLNPVEGPSPAKDYPDRAASFGNYFVKNVTRTVETTLGGKHGDMPATTSGYYSFGYFGMAIRGVETPDRPPLSPQPPNVRLGCASSYELFITDMSYDRVIDRAGWSRLSWSRVIDDISTASATIPDELGGVLCVARLGGLLPWAYGLRIERNDGLVWRGPIRRVERDGDDLVVSASDVLSRYRKRFATRARQHEHTNEDAGALFKDIFDHAANEYDAWTPAIPQVTVNVPVTRALRPLEFKYAWDLMSELLESAIDAFVMNGIVYVWEPNAGWRYQAVIKRTLDGPYNVNYDLVYGTFTEDAWARRPDWSIDGDFQGNYVVAPSSDSGEYGFRVARITQVESSQVAFGVLDFVDPNPIELPQDAAPATQNRLLRSRANSIAALRAYAPAVIQGGVLSEHAPIDVDNLIPGSLWKMDIFDAGYGQLTTAARLRRVDVAVRKDAAGIVEEISPTLEPPGWMGELES